MWNITERSTASVHGSPPESLWKPRMEEVRRLHQPKQGKEHLTSFFVGEIFAAASSSWECYCKFSTSVKEGFCWHIACSYRARMRYRAEKDPDTVYNRQTERAVL